MQRQYIHDEYQEYQPVRKYGPQYEPGGYASLVQQRSNMTQREDALKFEQGRIKALQEERLHIQKKTFTKWMNSFLQKARMEVDDLFVDLADGRRLLRLLEIISGERLARPNSGRMRVHKIENVNKSLAFLHTKVRLESIGAEDIVDGNPRLILGLIWTIILRFQIQEIEIDVDEENESSEKKSAKDALLLWCQRKTNGYHGVHIHNFTDSWRSGLGFNALIHAHRPDLFRWDELPKKTHIDNLNHAFDVADSHLGIPKLLDAEDVDTSRPDEKSVMTYVASYYHTFARMKTEQKSGRRIANIIGQLMMVDARKAQYARLATALLEWIQAKILELDSRELPNSLDGIQRLLLGFKQYRTVEKPPKYKERSEIEALYFDINTMQKSLIGEAWAPLEGQLPQDLERAWQRLERAEHARELALRTELLRQQRLEQLNYKFNTKSVLRKGYLKEMIQVLSDPRYGSNLAQVDATVKKHEAISADILARTERFEDLSAMAAELVREGYHGAEGVTRTEQLVLARWRELLELLAGHRESLLRLAQLMALVREADTTLATVEEMHAQFSSEEVGPHLAGVERLAQAHALRELQLGALDERIRRLVRQGAAAKGPPAPAQQLQARLKQLEDAYDSLIAAAKDRKARLEDARNLYQFLEDHDEEEGWLTDRQRICRAGVAAKDLRAVLALQQKHAALLHELRAREPVTERVLNKGKSLMEAKHPKSAEVQRRLESLERQRELLRELAAAREKQLDDAAEAYQFYADANESESWMKERRALAASADVGSDAPAAAALLARHRALHEEVSAYRPELDALRVQSEKLRRAGVDSLQLPTEVETAPATEEEETVKETRLVPTELPTEVETAPATEEEETVKETRLVPTEVWEEEPVERLEHRTVTEERSVPQVKALYAFTGQGISMAKGEVMFLINKTNPDWWSVRKADRTDGFVPANYVREIEPRIVPVQVRRPEKVRSVQRVKKTVLVKQVVAVKRPAAARRTSRAPPPAQPADTVEGRMKRIGDAYDELLQLSAARRQQLEDAIQLYEFYAECDDFDKWIREKEKLLRADDGQEGVETAERKYEKFVTDLSAASKRLERVDAAADALVSARRSQAARVTQRQQQLHHAWERLVRLKAAKEKSLEGASSVELFARTCDEARDWMAEKAQQLDSSGSAAAADLRTVRALQRRHAQLERELEPLREKVNTVDLLADSVKSQYPSEQANVDGRRREIQAMWQQCQAQAAERRTRLENAVGHRIFQHSSAALHDWLQGLRATLATEGVAKDVATAEALHKAHQEIKDDMKAHADEFKEVVGLGEKLVASNPTLADVAERVAALKADHDAAQKEWAEKEETLRQLVQLQTFNREADQMDASSGAHEAFLNHREQGSSVDEAEALLKRHEEFEARLAAQEERLRAFLGTADKLASGTHYAAEHVRARAEQVRARRAAVRAAAAGRRRALQAALAYQQFAAAADDLDAWVRDKMRTATDQNYRDLTNLERKLQKHEAYERELNANEKQLRNVDSVGQSLMAADAGRAGDVSARLGKLHRAWEELVAASRDKGSKLRQAAAQRAHRRSAEDAKARLVDLERSLRSEETGADHRSCKRLLQQHQALETELASWEQRAAELAAAGGDLVAAGHFDAPAIERDSGQLLADAAALRAPARVRRERLEEELRFHKFAAEVGNELQWVSERLPAASSDAAPADLHSAQHAHKKHAKLREEVAARGPAVERVLTAGAELAREQPARAEVAVLSNSLRDAYAQLAAAADARAARLEAALRARQFLHDALEVDSWLADKAAALASTDYGRDRHHAMQLLTRHKALELEVDTYAAIVAEMGHAAASMSAAQHPDAPALLERQKALTQSLQRLQRLAAQRQKALVESMCRHEFVVESAELEQWIQEQYAAASSEDYGQDYEHLLLLRSKFEELRHRVESGSERFNQCEELAKKLVASESPYIPDIEKRQEALGEAWSRLVEQIASRGARLAAAGDIHRFHRDVAEALARMADKRAQLDAPAAPRHYHGALALLRRHETLEHDLVALDAQLQVLQDDAARLQRLYPGGNVAQIARQQRALAAAWAGLRAAAAERRAQLAADVDLHRFLTQVRDLTSWSAALRASMAGEPRVRDAGAAQALRAEHDAAKSEVEAREDSFRGALELGQAMVQAGHRSAQEVEEKCSALLEERARLHGAWQARQVVLDQLIDLHFFLRDAKQLHSLCAAQEAALGTEISPTSSVEEVDNQLKKHEAFEKLLTTQDEKLSTLNTHGAKLLQQNHVESQRIADELELINQRRKKVHELSAARRAELVQALLRAQFARDAAEVRTWIAGKMKKLEADRGQGEVTSLEDKIKKLQKHQAFRAEIAANEERVAEVARTADKLRAGGDAKETLAALQQEWRRLLRATEERGRGLEEAQDMLEFNQHLDKIEAWIRDKEMMVQAHELGRDYEHCSALLRKLDDLDSDMRVDDKHIKSICALADKLLNQGPTQQSRAVQQRRDAFLDKWRALSGALQSYRDHLSAALEIHLFNRDVADTSERVSEKAALFASTETGRDLAAAQELRRKHDALATEATTIGDKIRSHRTEGARLADKYPDRAPEIEARLRELAAAWESLLRLAEGRSRLLGDAHTVHRFDESLKELELWVGESVKRMNTAEPPASVADAEALLELHGERKAEIDGRQKSVEALQQEAASLAALADSKPELVEKKVARLQSLSKSLEQAWSERKTYLTQAHQLQLLKEQARQTEDWLATKEAFLNNDDLGESLAAVETLIRKHKDFAKLLDSQLTRVDELERAAAAVAEGHRDRAYIRRRVAAVAARRDKLKESCEARGVQLQQSRQLQQFLRNLYHEQEWIALKMQIANDQNYRDLSNLQSKIQKHAAFESELQVNKTRIDDVGNLGEELIEAKHYASEEIAAHVASLEREWRALREAARARRERLAAAYQARVYLRGLDDFNLWLDDVESQLLSEDHGKDLASVSALLKRHGRLEQQVAGRGEAAAQLAETARHLADQGHFMGEEILERADAAVKRYRSLQEPVSVRRENLEDAQLLQRWERDADEELRWLREREPACRLDDTGATLAHAQSLQKKHLALEGELLSREPVVSALSARASELARRGHFAGAQLEARAQQLHEQLRALNELAAARRQRLQDALELHQFNIEAAEVETWIAERRPPLVSADVGRDEDSAVSLQRRLDAQQRQSAVCDAALAELEKLAGALQDRTTVDGAAVAARAAAARAAYEELQLLAAKRQQRLQQSLKYFKFVHECEEVQEWIGDQTAAAASEEYGQDVEHVETLQQAFDNFLASVNANEGRIEGVAEAGAALIEERTPEAERVRRRVEDVRGLWEDLKELALARQEALAGARQVHVFDRAADETVAWIAEKDSALGSVMGFGPQHDLDTIQALVRKHEALEADLEAVRQQAEQLTTEADRLGAAFPDAREHVASKLDEVTDGLSALLARAHESRDQLQRAEQLQTYFDSYRELMAWTSETLARTTAPELAQDVAGAELLLARHNDIAAEIAARDDAFGRFYADGEKLVSEGHFLSSEISERVSALRARRTLLDETWRRRADLYAQHHDALLFKRDADALDTWITTREPQLRDGKLGESVPHVEELIRKHGDFEKSIESQKDKFNALRRVTLVEQAFRAQQSEEAAARQRSAERQEAERLEAARRREMQRIAEERRREEVRAAPAHRAEREAEQMPAMRAREAAEEAREPPAPLDRQHSADKLSVKRAESMNVGMKTPKRTPSFTTRRRTQSFKRHQRSDVDLPPVEIKGYLERKQEAGCGGKRATVRSWRQYYAVLCGQLLCFFRDEIDFQNSKAAAPPVAILNARCEPAGDYTKRKHVFRLACADGAEFLFGCASRELLAEWVAKVSFHAALPPQLQLTPYTREAEQAEQAEPADSPTAAVRRKLHRTESSSSGRSSPEEARARPRTQAEILSEHRAQQRASPPRPQERQRVVESAVLPSLPPRQLPGSDDPTDVVMRNSEVPASSWGSTRFSNGRDLNAEFIRSQQAAENAPPLPPGGPPGPRQPDRPPAIPERGPTVPERAQNPNNQPPGQVTALVNSYQQRYQQQTSRNWQETGRSGTNSEKNWPETGRSGTSSEKNWPETGRSGNNSEKNWPETGRSGTNSEKNWPETGRSGTNSEKVWPETGRAGTNSEKGWPESRNNNAEHRQAESRGNNNWQEGTSHFYSASELAYGGKSSPPSRPASVSSAAPERHLSESSGESELSVAGVTAREKKDKRGVFGGLFGKKKKRPQSHM